MFQFAFVGAELFPTGVFATRIIVGVLVGFELFLVSFALFPTGFFARWLYQLRGLFVLFPTGVFAVSLCQFSTVDLLSPCLDLRPVGFRWLLFRSFPYQGFC